MCTSGVLASERRDGVSLLLLPLSLSRETRRRICRTGRDLQQVPGSAHLPDTETARS
jgi:hypothetical protein